MRYSKIVDGVSFAPFNTGARSKYGVFWNGIIRGENNDQEHTFGVAMIYNTGAKGYPWLLKEEPSGKTISHHLRLKDAQEAAIDWANSQPEFER